MKQFVTFLFFLFSMLAHAQEMNATVSAQQGATKTVFAQIVGINKNVLGIGNKISVEIDFGLEKNFWGRDGRDMVVDENGKEIKFNSMVDAMNFMGERGWTYEDSYVVTIANQHVIHWLLSKVIPIDGDARDNIKQHRDTSKPKKKQKEFNKADDPLYF